jgi:hypothetical protein
MVVKKQEERGGRDLALSRLPTYLEVAEYRRLFQNPFFLSP